MRQHPALQLVVKKLSMIFYCIFKVFLIMNMILLGVVAYTSKSTFLFFIFFMNYWIMMIMFCLLSMYIKLFICITHMENISDDQSWIYSVIFFPLMGEESEEDIIQFISQNSFENSQEQHTQPPTTENLDTLATRWSNVIKNTVVSTEMGEELCLICANPYHHEYPTHKGCVGLGCCPAIFHKKCVLEWFHFNEKQDQSNPDKTLVSCPSCRHLFVS